METKFTEGEWETNSQNVWSGDIFICSINEIDTFNKDIEAVANSKIIVAAPNMFNSIVKLQEWSKKYPVGRIYTYREVSALEKELTEIIEEQLKAIQKAVGYEIVF